MVKRLFLLFVMVCLMNIGIAGVGLIVREEILLVEMVFLGLVVGNEDEDDGNWDSETAAIDS